MDVTRAQKVVAARVRRARRSLRPSRSRRRACTSTITRPHGCPNEDYFDFCARGWHDGCMELRHLRTIVAVAEHRSLTKAGEELYLTQSAVSQQIRRLEQELEVDVFRRTSRSVELTPE